ncbi:MAG: crossover junction endodeoxyribonuclease RuvC [Sandaracinaceae bacterium]|nr:crossover junction endodeoxyribonuclease RuvC [Sandaracinaceae bacterium]
MRVLGVDPGTVRTGFGIVEQDGTRLIGIVAGVLKEKESASLEIRLKGIFDGLTEIIRVHQPTHIAVEDIFFAKFPQAALKLGHARGVALLAAANVGLEVHAYPPAVVKRAIGGRGHSEKTQVARMVGAILGWATLPSIDATDALAVAITHANVSSVRSAILAAPRPKRAYGAKKSRV